MLCTRRCSDCCFRNLMQVFNKFRFIIARSRSVYATRRFNCFLEFFAIFIELIRSTSFSFSFDSEVSCTWLRVLSFSSTCSSESKLFSTLIISSIRLCENNSFEVSRLRAWLRVSRSQLNIVLTEQLRANEAIKIVKLLKFLWMKLRS